MHAQPSLFAFRMGERSPETLVLAQANREAALLLTGWRYWPSGALALIGPSGSGKTHLALAWALEAQARQLAAEAGPEEAAAAFTDAGGRLLVDDADRGADEGAIWRVLDLASASGGAVLLVGTTAPGHWPVRTPDLRSRLAAMPVARLGEPDEALLDAVLRRMCRERFMHLSDEAAVFLVPRMPRTFAAARTLVDMLEREVERGARPISAKLARRAYDRARSTWIDAEDG